MDSAAVDFPTHSLRERVVVTLMAKTLRRMEDEGSVLARQIAAAQVAPPSSGGEARAAAPLAGGQGGRVDAKA